MSLRPDPIALVEACYDLKCDEQTWLQRIAKTAHALLARATHGVVAYNLELAGASVRMPHAVQAGGETDVVTQLRSLSQLLERRYRGEASLFERGVAGLYQKVVLAGLRSSVDCMFMTEMNKIGPDWMYTLGVPGVHDHFILISHHIDGNGATVLAGGLSRKGTLRHAERQMYQMLSAHIKAGQRLRRRLGALHPGVDGPDGGAVLDADARLLHAEGEAKEAEVREQLVRSARAIDGARSERLGRNAEALEVWQGLVAGRWSLVERFDADGKRFMLAHRNPEDVVDPRGLTSSESRVTGLAVRGYTNKLIAYHLGISAARPARPSGEFAETRFRQPAGEGGPFVQPIRHHLGGVPKGRLFPLSRDDLLDCAALLESVKLGELDRILIPEAPLDVLAQQLVATTAHEEWDIKALYELVRSAYPYRNLPRERFDQVLQMLAEGFTTHRGRRGADADKRNKRSLPSPGAT